MYLSNNNLRNRHSKVKIVFDLYNIVTASVSGRDHYSQHGTIYIASCSVQIIFCRKQFCQIMCLRKLAVWDKKTLMCELTFGSLGF